MNTELRKEVAQQREIDELTAAERPPLRSIPPQPVSLGDQWTKLEVIERELRDRIRREHVSIIADHDRQWTDLQNIYARNLSESKAKLDKEHAEALRALENETMTKLREHDMLAKRMG